MNKIENYLGVANHDIQMANNSQELKSYVASILYENDELRQENQKYKEVIDKIKNAIDGDIDGFITINEYGECNAILDLLEIYKDILKEV